MLPKSEPFLEIANAVAFELYSSRYVWNPSKRTARSETGAESRAFMMLIARMSEVPANLRDRIGVQPELGRASCAKGGQVNPARPSSSESADVASLRFSLGSDAEVPDLIAAYREFIKSLAASAVFDAELESRDTDHGSVLLSLGRIKNALRAGKPSARSSFISQNQIQCGARRGEG